MNTPPQPPQQVVVVSVPERKPVAAMILAILGGLATIGLSSIYYGLWNLCSSLSGCGKLTTSFGSIFFVPTYITNNLQTELLLIWTIGILAGVLMLVFGVLAYAKSKNAKIFGALILVFSLVGLFFAGGGLFIGFILGLIAAILAMVYKPSSATVTTGYMAAGTPPPPPPP